MIWQIALSALSPDSDHSITFLVFLVLIFTPPEPGCSQGGGGGRGAPPPSWATPLFQSHYLTLYKLDEKMYEQK